MTIAANLGYPRIGPRRELKTALEAHWAGRAPEAELLATAAKLRRESRAFQAGIGISHIPSGDFALYDHVLETACALGVIPDGYGWDGEGPASLATLFALARGNAASPALEMTKWFDTNYHYLVPRLSPQTRPRLLRNPWAEAVAEGLATGTRTRPVMLGPVSFLLLGKGEAGCNPLDLLPALLPAYAQALRGMAAAGAAWVQLDEPCLVTDLPAGGAAAYRLAYQALAETTPDLDILLATYFGGLGENLPLAFELPVEGVHLDLVRGAEQLDAALDAVAPHQLLSLGLVDGRNVWRTDLRHALGRLQHAAARLGERRLMVAPSCSLLHVPHSLAPETDLPPALHRRLAFAHEKLAEIVVLARALESGEASAAEALKRSDAIQADIRADRAARDPAVAARLAGLTPAMERRAHPYAERAPAQRARLNLPPLPVTGIGSLPQTAEVRRLRASLNRGETTPQAHDAAMRRMIADAVRWQEEIGVDVLVHGEFERNDMVKHFGEQLAGYAFTRHGWVQSYGSRCVAPPIIWRDVWRPAAMTVEWARYAQSLTARPVKGMLTGPVTMLQWSFVRDDIAREAVCTQIALAIRDEVAALEAAGIAIIQIDEPAFREGLPLRAAARADYLRWAVRCFRLSAAVVGDATQIHTHMCYAEFNDIIEAIAAMDADVISIETARSDMELLRAFGDFDYPNEIGPGVWDIHSPRVPSAEEMAALFRGAMRRIPAGRLWLNPDCGCKTRGWAEVRPAMANLVAASRRLRAELV